MNTLVHIHLNNLCNIKFSSIFQQNSEHLLFQEQFNLFRVLFDFFYNCSRSNNCNNIQISTIKKIYNISLDFVNQTRLNEIETVPDNFFIYAWKAVYALMSWKSWTFVFLFTLVAFLALALLFLLSASDKKRRMLFVGSCVMLVFTLLSLAQSISGYRQINYTRNAIIMQEATSLKSAPDQTGTSVMVLRPGVKIRILEFKTPWLKVTAPDGTQGWMPENNVARLNANAVVNGY